MSKRELEFVEAEEKDGDVVVTCTEGELHLSFDLISIWLDDRHPISLYDLEKAANDFWTEWKAKIPKKEK